MKRRIRPLSREAGEGRGRGRRGRFQVVACRSTKRFMKRPQKQKQIQKQKQPDPAGATLLSRGQRSKGEEGVGRIEFSSKAVLSLLALRLAPVACHIIPVNQRRDSPGEAHDLLLRHSGAGRAGDDRRHPHQCGALQSSLPFANALISSKKPGERVLMLGGRREFLWSRKELSISCLGGIGDPETW